MKRTIKSFMLIFSYLAMSSNVWANDAKSFIEILKTHYAKTSNINAFSLTHSYLGRSDPYQSWDYQSPTRYQAFKVTEIDTTTKQYYQNVVHHYTGGLYFDEIHFQNREESLRYERNGISLGKRVIKQKMNSFDRYKSLTQMNLDFFAVKPLLTETNIEETIEYTVNLSDNTISLIHKPSQKKTMEYVFKKKPLRLISINDKTRKRIYLYDNYRHNGGYFFAHSLIKKYNGDKKPSFITRLEKFEAISQIDQDKLSLPSGYYHAKSSKSQALISTKVAQDLYLLTDSSANNNILMQVNNNEITVFGVPRSKKSSQQLIEKINQDFSKPKIKGIFVTHPYSDHIAGLLPFVEIGATIYANGYTINAIKAFPRFANDIEHFKFEEIKHKQTKHNVQFYVLENARAKRQSFAYFQQGGIIYQADFLEVAQDNTIAKMLPSYSKQFIDFIRNEKLNFSRIVGYHRNNDISPSVVDKSYNAVTM